MNSVVASVRSLGGGNVFPHNWPLLVNDVVALVFPATRTGDGEA